MHKFFKKYSSLFLPAILITITIVLLMSLGFWQLDRAQQKKDIQLQRLAASNKPLLAIDASQILNKHYHNVILSGRYITDKQFIYDNQVLQQKAGYYVLTPFLIDGSNKAIIVNRGFVAWQQGYREVNKDIGVNTDNTEIVAQLIPTPGKRLELDNSDTTAKFPLMIQAVNIDLMSNLIERELINSFALLSPDADNGFLRQWQPSSAGVSKHIGYAIQWFLMAFILFIISIYLIIKNRNNF